jgi:hypothetical protein
MASNHQSPFWNQDAIMAGGLAFAGMAVLQSKLLRTIGAARLLPANWLHFLTGVLDWPGFEWWPVLLIVAGAGLWFRKTRSVKTRAGSAMQTGGGR